MRIEHTRLLLYAALLCIQLLLTTGSVSAADAPSAATTEAPTAYIDQLIDPLAPGGEEFLAEETQQPQGYRSFSTEYRHFQQHIDTAGRPYEDGIILHGCRETRDYGELEMFATTRYERPLSVFEG